MGRFGAHEPIRRLPNGEKNQRCTRSVTARWNRSSHARQSGHITELDAVTH